MDISCSMLPTCLSNKSELIWIHWVWTALPFAEVYKARMQKVLILVKTRDRQRLDLKRYWYHKGLKLEEDILWH